MPNLPTPTQELFHPLLEEKGIRLFVKRDDLIHDEVMGNKWRKLKFNLEAMKSGSFAGILTMGGAYSNHIAATAALAREHKIPSIGIIRGDELSIKSNPTLQKAAEDGMKMVFKERGAYRELRNDPKDLLREFPGYYLLPEGGTNHLAIKGCKEIISEISESFDLIATSMGTGGTMAGLVACDSHKVLGFSSLKGSFIRREFAELLKKERIQNNNYEIQIDYHFGGYGKVTSELIDFINWFKEMFHIRLDPIYTGKTFFGVWNMIKSDKFEKNLRIVLLHTGGLQGIRGFNRKSENIIQ